MGVSAETQDPDITAAFAGGDTFLSRMQQLSAAKVAAEKAEASLNLAMSAKAIMDQAEAKTADADRALTDARKQAQALVEAANDAAAAKIKDGDDQRTAAMALANEGRIAADAYAVETRANADAAMQVINRLNEAAAAKLAGIEAREKAADDKAVGADAAKAIAENTRAQLNDALDTLRTACAKVLATG